MSTPPIHQNPKIYPGPTDHPDSDPTYRSGVNWGSTKKVTKSGIPIMYDGLHYCVEPVNGPPRGIGIWKRESPNYRSRDGLLELPLHPIVTRWIISGTTFGLRLPIMGMPPREPSLDLMVQVRSGIKPFSDWFEYATVIPARLFAEFVKIDPKTGTMELRGSWKEYNYSTASPCDDLGRVDVSEKDKSLDNLYYIQLLRNELPSYHFWSHSTDPIGEAGRMRHGLISKGATACYDIEGDDMITSVCMDFNRTQTLPLRNADAVDLEQITSADPPYAPRSKEEPQEI